MPRPLRFIPKDSMVEVTTRTIQGRLLLRPSRELNEIFLGIIGKAQHDYGMTIHGFVATSNHVHFLLSPSTALRLARFMQFVNANFAKEAARLHRWPDRIWSRRYRAIPIVDDCAAQARMRYLLSHGAKEGLVAGARSWPGINCIAALTHGDTLRGTWFDRTAEYHAKAAGKKVRPGDFATAYEVRLTPLPCLKHMNANERQTEYRQIVHDIDKKAKETNERLGRNPLGVRAILAQDPHHCPDTIKRSPAPLVHAFDRDKRIEYRTAYRDFVAAFRAGAADLTARANELTKLFPDWSFPPPLRFKEAPKAS